MKIIDKKVSELLPYANNPRRNDPAVDAVAASIREFGFKVPIVIDSNNEIIAGHTRLKAAKRLGLQTVPCIIADDLTPEQVKAFRLADNKVSELAEWDLDLLSLELEGLPDFDMEQFGFEKEQEEPEVQEDDYDVVPPIEPIAKLGDIYQLGDHRLMCGDSTRSADVERLMNGQKADLLITDPPYNVNYEGTAGKIQNDNMSDANFRQFLIDAFSRASESMKPGAAFYIWHADSEGFNFRSAAREVGWQVRQCLIWNKSSLVLGRQDYQWKHEPCLYGWKDGAAHYFIDDRAITTVIEDKPPEFKKMKKDELIELLQEIYSEKVSTTVIDEAKPSSSAEHPTMKPLKLLARHVRNSSKPDDLVLDLFGGSGSTLMTCEQLGRTCYTMELDPRFVDVIINRWEEFTNQKAIKLAEEAGSNESDR